MDAATCDGCGYCYWNAQLEGRLRRLGEGRLSGDVTRKGRQWRVASKMMASQVN